MLSRVVRSVSSSNVLVTLRDIKKVFPDTDRTLFKSVNAYIERGAKIGVIGANGTGKSTLLRIVAKEDDTYDGEVVHSANVKVGYLQQEPILDYDKTVIENVRDGLKHFYDKLDAYNELCQQNFTGNAELIAKVEAIEEMIETHDLWNLDTRVKTVMSCLNCPPRHSDVTNLSGGEKRRIALARLLLSAPDLLILDEPTNHLDSESILWLEEYLAAFMGSILSVTHDRFFLNNMATHIYEIDNGNFYSYRGNLVDWQKRHDERVHLQQKKAGAVEKLIKQEKKIIAKCETITSWNSEGKN